MTSKKDNEGAPRNSGAREAPAGAAPGASAAAPIIDAALKLLREHRALDLSMREIAVAAGVTPSLVAYHFESRPHVVASACAVAGEGWRQKLGELADLAVGVESAARRAELCSAWMAGIAAERPELARLWGDLLLAAAREPLLDAVARDWVSAWRDAWLPIAGGNGGAAEIVGEFAAFEMIFTAPLLGIADRELIMREALRRVFLRVEGASLAAAEDCHWHTRFCLDRMDPLPAPAAPDRAVKARIIDAAADIIAFEGASAATHRAIAARAGASLSSMTYHFESRAMLVREGLLRVFQRSMTSRPLAQAEAAPWEQVAVVQLARSVRGADGAPGERLAMVRAIAEVAQEAAIDPSFRAVAMELRRIRGLVTRQSIAHALGLSEVAGATAADYAIWESGAALLRDVERRGPNAGDAGGIARALRVFF